jgi:acetolactate synthase-1/2/3 large subunit
MYRAERPNTCIISNGFAAMGIAVPGAIAAKLAYPDRTVVAVTGDAGFMMNSQEIETALRMKTPIVVLIWNDSEYGLITWHQLRHFGRPSHIAFKNPDFVKYAESFGAKGYRVERAEDLVPTLKTGDRRRHRRDHRLPGRLCAEHAAHGAAEGDDVAAVNRARALQSWNDPR